MSVLAATDTSQAQDPTGFFGVLAHAAEWFIGLFQAGADNFVGLLVGIIPLLIVLLTAVNALVRAIGVERIERFGEMAARPGSSGTRSATWCSRSSRSSS